MVKNGSSLSFSVNQSKYIVRTIGVFSCACSDNHFPSSHDVKPLVRLLLFLVMAYNCLKMSPHLASMAAKVFCLIPQPPFTACLLGPRHQANYFPNIISLNCYNIPINRYYSVHWVSGDTEVQNSPAKAPSLNNQQWNLIWNPRGSESRTCISSPSSLLALCRAHAWEMLILFSFAFTVAKNTIYIYLPILQKSCEYWR